MQTGLAASCVTNRTKVFKNFQKLCLWRQDANQMTPQSQTYINNFVFETECKKQPAIQTQCKKRQPILCDESIPKEHNIKTNKTKKERNQRRN